MCLIDTTYTVLHDILQYITRSTLELHFIRAQALSNDSLHSHTQQFKEPKEPYQRALQKSPTFAITRSN